MPTYADVCWALLESEGGDMTDAQDAFKIEEDPSGGGGGGGGGDWGGGGGHAGGGAQPVWQRFN
jgi:hypothetical protein